MRPILGACFVASAAAASAAPRQIHVSYGADPQTTATVVWASEAPCVPAAQYGPASNALVNVSAPALVAEPEWTFDNALGLHYYMRGVPKSDLQRPGFSARLPPLPPALRPLQHTSLAFLLVPAPSIELAARTASGVPLSTFRQCLRWSRRSSRASSSGETWARSAASRRFPRWSLRPRRLARARQTPRPLPSSPATTATI